MLENALLTMKLTSRKLNSDGSPIYFFFFNSTEKNAINKENSLTGKTVCNMHNKVNFHTKERVATMVRLIIQ